MGSILPLDINVPKFVALSDNHEIDTILPLPKIKIYLSHTLDKHCTQVIFNIMTVNTQVLIIGGSINGATLALSLGQNNIDVTLIEPKTIIDTNKLIFDGRAYALALTTQKMFDALNIWNKLEKFSEPILDIKIGKNNNTNSFSETLLHFDHYDMSEESKPMGYILEDRYLRSELLSKIQNCNNIKIIDNCYVSNYVFMPGEVAAELSNGKTIKSKIIIGCDGQNSKIAKLAKINRFGWKYNQASLVLSLIHI